MGLAKRKTTYEEKPRLKREEKRKEGGEKKRHAWDKKPGKYQPAVTE